VNGYDGRWADNPEHLSQLIDKGRPSSGRIQVRKRFNGEKFENFPSHIDVHFIRLASSGVNQLLSAYPLTVLDMSQRSASRSNCRLATIAENGRRSKFLVWILLRHLPIAKPKQSIAS
jgi:hypothetical protein